MNPRNEGFGFRGLRFLDCLGLRVSGVLGLGFGAGFWCSGFWA